MSTDTKYVCSNGVTGARDISVVSSVVLEVSAGSGKYWEGSMESFVGDGFSDPGSEEEIA